LPDLVMLEIAQWLVEPEVPKSQMSKFVHEILSDVGWSRVAGVNRQVDVEGSLPSIAKRCSAFAVVVVGIVIDRETWIRDHLFQRKP